MAAGKGSVGIVRKLIQHGANLNHANKVNFILNCLNWSLAGFVCGLIAH